MNQMINDFYTTYLDKRELAEDLELISKKQFQEVLERGMHVIKETGAVGDILVKGVGRTRLVLRKIAVGTGSKINGLILTRDEFEEIRNNQ